MKITLSSQIIQEREVIQAEIDGYTMLMSLEEGKYFALNPVGAQIWRLLANSSRVQNVCQSLLEEYEVPEDKCQQEVLTFVQMLLEKKLIRGGDEAMA